MIPDAWWQMFAERVASCPWGGIAVLGVTLGMMWLLAIWLADRSIAADCASAAAAARRIEEVMPAPKPERLTLARRVALFESLVDDWRALGEPVDAGWIRYMYALTGEELRDLLNWLRGMARLVDGAHHIAIVERGAVRFRVVGQDLAGIVGPSFAEASEGDSLRESDARS